MSMITSLASGLSVQKQQATAQQVQVALMKKVLDSQEQMGAELVKMLNMGPSPLGVDPVRGTMLDIYA